MTTAHAQMPAPLSFVTAETALAAYQLACTTGAAESYETAAHALAVALRCERARRMAPRPAGGVKPRLVVDNDPTGQSAPPPAKSSRKSALKPADDLDHRHPGAKRGAPAGSFLIEWADGSETRVQGVAWPAAKAATRWARAYQAANRVRRARFGRTLEADLGGARAIMGRYTTLSGGHKVDSPEWRALLASTPLPALAAIVDETTGERFNAPEGSTYGAGDAEEAQRVGAAICLPRMPWLQAEAAKSNRLYGRDNRHYMASPEPVTYFVDRTEDAIHSLAYASPWPDNYRQMMIRDAELAFALPVETVEEAEAVSAGPVVAAYADDVDGLSVMVTPDGLARASAAETTARKVYDAARARASNGQLDADGRDAKAALEQAKAVHDTLGRLGARAWAATRAPGGSVKLSRPGLGAVLSMAGVAFLDRVANPAG